MPTVKIPGFSEEMSQEELVTQLKKLKKTLQYLTSHMDHANVRQLYTEYCNIQSEDGETVIDGPLLTMRAAGSTTTRLKMGHSTVSNDFIFELYNSTGGKTVGIDSTGNATFTGIITGGIIRTESSGNTRLEMSGGSFRGITASGALGGLAITPGSTASNYIDVFLYHSGTKLVEFYDNALNFTIRGTSDATEFGLGGSACVTKCYGTWDFSGATIQNFTS